MTRGGAEVAREAHNLKVGGSIPPPATNKMEDSSIIKHTDDVTIFEILKGHLLTEDYDDLREEFDENLPECRKTIILDLSKVEYISSLILTYLMYMLKKSTDAGKELVIKNVKPKVMEILSSTSLDKVFKIVK